tara:strand:- start:8094 stop:9080 length:987 start_codon:yes stop_codon:yes gene_type:complete
MGKKRVALITGITGQDGSYLADLLLEKGYRVIGAKRRTSTIRTERIDHIYENEDFILEYFDLGDASSMWRLLSKHKPDEIYNLAAQSHVRVSFDVPLNTVDGVAMGTLRLLEAMKHIVPKARFYQASSSEMFGDNTEVPFNEESKFMPASPYACAKVFAHNLIRNYRESYGLHASSGILFNHESPRRGETFVTRKITLAAARIKLGLQDKLHLGNINAKRDWGFAGDYVKAMWLMLQQDKPDDYVIATGRMYSVAEFAEMVFKHAGLGSYKKYVEIDERLFRPHEVPKLLGDCSKAKWQLDWRPEMPFEDLCKALYDHDYELLKGETK